MRVQIRRRFAFLASAAAFEATALPAHAREADAEVETKTFCIAGRPLSSCRSFLVATGSYHPRIGGSSHARELSVGRGTARVDVGEMESHFDVEVGAAMSVGLDEGTGCAWR